MLDNFYFIFCGTGPSNLKQAHSGFTRFSEQLNFRGINGHFLAPSPIGQEIDFQNKPADFYEQEEIAMQKWLEANFPADLDLSDSFVVVFEPLDEVKEEQNKLNETQKNTLLKKLYPDMHFSANQKLPKVFHNRVIQSTLLSNPGIKNLICIVGHESMGVSRAFLSKLNYPWLMLALSQNEVNLNATTSLFAAFSALEISFASNKIAPSDRQVILNTERKRKEVLDLLSRMSQLKVAKDKLPQLIDRFAPHSKGRIEPQIELTNRNIAKHAVNIVMVAADDVSSEYRTQPIIASVPKGARFANFISVKFTLQILFPTDTRNLSHLKAGIRAQSEKRFIFLSQNVIEMLDLKSHYFSQGKVAEDLRLKANKIKRLLKSSDLAEEEILQLKQEKKDITQEILNLPYMATDEDHAFTEVLAQQIDESKGEVVLCISPNRNITYRRTLQRVNSLYNLEQPNLFFLAHPATRSYEQYVSFFDELVDKINQKTKKQIWFYLMPSTDALDNACVLFSKLSFPELIGPLLPLSQLKLTLRKQAGIEKATLVHTPIQRVFTRFADQSWSTVQRNFLGELRASPANNQIQRQPVEEVCEKSDVTGAPIAKGI